MKLKKKMTCAATAALSALLLASCSLPNAAASESGNTNAATETIALSASTNTNTVTVTRTTEAERAAAVAYDLSKQATVTIDADGVYRITGSSSEGGITVSKGVTATIILDNVTLGSSTTAPIVCKKESNVTIELIGVSTLTNAEDIANEESDDFEGAVIKAKAGSSLIITGDGELNVNGETKNGVKAAEEARITIESGTLNITAANDAVNSGADLTVTGGTLTITAGDDALHADGVLTIGAEGSEYGPAITVRSCSEGFEGAQVILNAGTGVIHASDDGINAASDENGTVSITVNGGEWYVDAEGDGLDAGGESNRGNGSITLNGGSVTVYGAANDGNGALDSESGIVYNGGTLIAIGMSGMAEAPSGGNVLVFGGAGMGGGQMPQMNGQSGQQFPQMSGQSGQQMPQMGGRNGGQQSSVTITAGSVITITDASGNVICESVGVKNANSVIFASEAVVEGETYTLNVDGTAVATAVAGQGGGMPGGFGGGMPGMGGMPGQNGGN